LGPVRQLRDLVRERSIDVLHCHGYRENFYATVARVAIPRVTTNHLWKRTTAALRFYAWVDARLLRAFDRIVGVSAEIHTELAALGFRAPQLAYIANGVDVDRYAAVRAPPDGRRVVVLAVGSLTAEKGHEHLLAAVAKLPDRCDVRVRIAGEGPRVEPLRARARELGVAANVDFLGRRDDVPELLADADVFVLPSLSEGLPIALLEAMAAAKACIGTDVGDVPRAVEHEVTGLLVRRGDSEALAAAIARLVADSGLRLRLGAAARRRVIEVFSSRRMVQDYCRLYDGLFAPD
jgi:glycosyltransferase involved in cell wall biosynthesis